MGNRCDECCKDLLHQGERTRQRAIAKPFYTMKNISKSLSLIIVALSLQSCLDFGDETDYEVNSKEAKDNLTWH